MNTSNVNTAQAYYTAMSAKNVAQMEQYLHEDVQLISPFGKSVGKMAVIDAVKKFTSYFEKLTIQAPFGSDDQAVVVYDVSFAQPIGNVRSASYMTFKDGRIKNIELLFDARPFVK
jgi:ketosteroid isomerase-like protein